MMIKEDPIKLKKKEELRKEANQETVWQSTSLSTAHKGLSTGLSTALNREATQFRFSTGFQAYRQGPVDNPNWPVDNQ